MREIRERGSSGRIKEKGGRQGHGQKEMRRQMTAKLRKELTERQRGGDGPEAEAVDQAEQIAGAAVEEVETGVRQTVSKAAAKRKKGQTERAGSSHADPEKPEPPTPGERMRQAAVKETQEQAKQPKTAETSPVREYQRPAVPEHPKENRSLKNPSINQSIRERPRRSQKIKEKPPGGALRPKTRQSVEAAAKKKTGATAQKVMEKAKDRVKKNAQKKMAQSAGQTAKRAADFSRKAAAAAVKAVKAIISTLAALIGGTTLVAALCAVVLIAAIAASPFGILFSNEPSRDAIPLNAAVSQINMELSDTLEALQDGSYDGIDIEGQPPDWKEVVAVFAVKTTSGDDAVDVAALTADRVDRLRGVFWDMCSVTSEVETIHHGDSDPNDEVDDSWTEHILHISIAAQSAEDMRTAYGFTENQNQMLTELLAELDVLDTLLGDLSVSQEAALALYRSLPEDLSPERKAVIKQACSLVGKVNYFWGGKSLVLGWDSRWGQVQKVWAANSTTTGTYRPYGLDCSGFADWVFYNASGGEYIIGHGGGAAAQHSHCVGIEWDEALPGDLVFYPGDEHVGIVGGWDEDGNLLIIHCASGYNNVVITGADGFTMIGRPEYFEET